MHVGYGAVFQNPGNRPVRHRGLASTKSGWPRWPNRWDSSRSGRSNITSTTTRCVPTSAVSELHGRTDQALRSWARWSWCCRGTIRFASPNRSRCLTIFPTAASSSASDVVSRGSNMRASVSIRTRGAHLFVEYAELVLNALEKGYMEGGASHQSAAPRNSALSRALVQGTHLCGRGLPRIDADHGEARRRRAGDPAEALGRRQKGLRGLP